MSLLGRRARAANSNCAGRASAGAALDGVARTAPGRRGRRGNTRALVMRGWAGAREASERAHRARDASAPVVRARHPSSGAVLEGGDCTHQERGAALEELGDARAARLRERHATADVELHGEGRPGRKCVGDAFCVVVFDSLLGAPPSSPAVAAGVPCSAVRSSESQHARTAMLAVGCTECARSRPCGATRRGGDDVAPPDWLVAGAGERGAGPPSGLGGGGFGEREEGRLVGRLGGGRRAGCGAGRAASGAEYGDHRAH